MAATATTPSAGPPPAADTPTGGGNLTLGYYDTDAVASISQDGTTTEFTLDTVGRRQDEATGPTGQSATTTTVRHYTDTGDNPAWVTVTDSAETKVTRFATSLGGDLGLTLTSPATSGAVEAELTLADPHGDTIATVPVPTTGPCVGIDGWADHDEYGNPTSSGTTGTTGAVTHGLGYGWLGAKQRATTSAGLTLMGARVYNRVTGQFTSIDPIHGGNATAYGYPVDPTNQFDLDGLHSCGWFSKVCSGAGWVTKKAVGFGKGVSVGYSACASYIIGGCLSASVGYRDGLSFGWAGNGRDKRNLGNRASYGFGAGPTLGWQNKKSPKNTYCAGAIAAYTCSGRGGFRSFTGSTPSPWGGWTKNGSFWSKRWW